MVILYKKARLPYLLIALLVIISTLLLWSPFILKLEKINGVKVETPNFETVIKNWDGPLYIIPAKTLYDKNHPLFEQKPLGLPENYFAAHLPLYPLTIRFFAPFLGYPKAMLFSTLFFSILLFSFFYYLVKKLKLTPHPFLLTLVFMFITPRFFVVRSIGSPEPLFLLLILGSIYFFSKENYFWAGVMGGLSAMTKTPAVLLFIAYSFVILGRYISAKKLNWRWFSILLIPLALLAVFLLYQIKMGDFFAYFRSGDNIHLSFPPFSVFNFKDIWVQTGWLEEIIFIYFFYLLTVFKLLPAALETKNNSAGRVREVFFYFTVIFFLSIVSIRHLDIARYSLPILPLALISHEKFFTSKKFLFALLFLLPAIYLYAWNFMLFNIAPITDWTPFL